MKTMVRNFASKGGAFSIARFSCASLVLVTASILAACGGGGGGGTTPVTPPPPTSVSATVTCPNGSSSTSTGADTAAATAAANALCPTGKLVSVTPKDAATAVSPDTFTGVAVTLDSAIDASSLTTANVTLKTGTTATSATVTADGTKGFMLATTSKLAYDKPYSFTANVKDTLGRVITVTTSFVTGAKVCETNMIWKQELDQCIYQMGVWVLTANQVPVGCDNETQSCWTEFFSKGPDTGLKLIDTNAVMTGFSTETVAFGFWKNHATAFGVTGLWNYVPLYTKTRKLVYGSVGLGGITSEIDRVYSPKPGEGYLPGIIAHEKPTGLCYLMAWDVKQQGWYVNGNGDGKPTTCPQ